MIEEGRDAEANRPHGWIDLLLLEEVMRLNVETSKSARLAQTLCMTTVAVLLFSAFLYVLTHPEDPRVAAKAPAEISALPGYVGIPQP
jgi:hypothetical protein